MIGITNQNYQLPQIKSSFEVPNDNFNIITVKKGTVIKNGQAIPFRMTALQFNGKNRHQRRREEKISRKITQLVQPEMAMAQVA